MRILYIDIDSLRPDHLGCYGYHRATSPNIDRPAGQSDDSGNLSAIVAADRTFPAAVAELGSLGAYNWRLHHV